jgi:hydroxypyruvate isomerase
VTRFAVNVGFLYPELLPGERFVAARADGFEAVESAWPADPAAFVGGVRDAGLRVALLNVAAGDLAAGERGYGHDPAATARWRAAFEQALRLADDVDCPTLNVLAGNGLADVDLDAQWACLRANLGWALPLAASVDRTLVVELLNPFETPDYLVPDLDSARRLIEPLADAGLRLQFDTWHVGRLGLDVAATFSEVGGLVGHVQIADVPGRHEPGSGALDWRRFFGALAEAGYAGAVGLEYRPAAGTSAGLAWLPSSARGWSADPFIPPPAA